tara:strand:+ start:597 stop:758 length:162 start_codon:yes stop_codon:yes gene_type:complete
MFLNELIKLAASSYRKKIDMEKKVTKAINTEKIPNSSGEYNLVKMGEANIIIA